VAAPLANRQTCIRWSAVARSASRRGDGDPDGCGCSDARAVEWRLIRVYPATMAAPPENPTRQDELTRSVDGVAFPYWEDSHGWRSTGARIDRISGRWVTTVFYANSRGQRIGYAIVAGAPAPKLSGGALIWRSDRPYRLLAEKGVQLVAWNRDGHLCILGARGVSSAELLRLAG